MLLTSAAYMWHGLGTINGESRKGRMAMESMPRSRECITGRGATAKRYLSIEMSRRLARAIERQGGMHRRNQNEEAVVLIEEALAARESTMRSLFTRAGRR